MATLPKLADLYSNIRADIDAEFGVNISLAKKVALRAEAAMYAGKLWLMYKVLGFVQKNVAPDTADPESKGGTLERFGRLKLGRNPRAAVAGKYSVQAQGTASAIVPAEKVFKADDNSSAPGKLFILDAEHTMGGSTDDFELRALTPGVEAKLEVGDTLTAVSPIPQVNSQVTVLAETVQPLAAESIEAYRTATTQSYRLSANGGSPADYRLWALDAQGVAAVYPYAKNGEANANNIYVEATEADSSDGKGTPTPSILSEYESVIAFNPDTTLQTYERGRKPGSVLNYVQAVTVLDVEIEISGGSFTAAQQALIATALQNAVKLTRPFVAAADIASNKNDILDTNKINAIIFSQVPGAVYGALTLKVNSVAVLTYTFTGGNIPYLDTADVTFS